MEGAGDTVTAPALLHPGVLALSGLHPLGYAPTPAAGSTESPGLRCGPPVLACELLQLCLVDSWFLALPLDGAGRPWSVS